MSDISHVVLRLNLPVKNISNPMRHLSTRGRKKANTTGRKKEKKNGIDEKMTSVSGLASSETRTFLPKSNDVKINL